MISNVFLYLVKEIYLLALLEPLSQMKPIHFQWISRCLQPNMNDLSLDNLCIIHFQHNAIRLLIVYDFSRSNIVCITPINEWTLSLNTLWICGVPGIVMVVRIWNLCNLRRQTFFLSQCAPSSFGVIHMSEYALDAQ